MNITDIDRQHCDDLIASGIANGYGRWYAARQARDAVAVGIACDLIAGEDVTDRQKARFIYLYNIYAAEHPVPGMIDPIQAGVS